MIYNLDDDDENVLVNVSLYLYHKSCPTVLDKIRLKANSFAFKRANLLWGTYDMLYTEKVS